MRSRARERGAVSVEFALAMPLLLLLVLGGLHLGRVLGARHRLSDAASYAVRAAAVARTPDGATVRALLLGRLGPITADCASVEVTSSVAGAAPYRRLDVNARCVLQPPFGVAALGSIGPGDISVRASMPY